MDAFDNKDEFFKKNRFGKSGKYWVRSTKKRDNRVYPTKSIICFALKINGANKANGSWSKPRSMAFRLHNSGFIIMDKNNKPEALTEHKHLILNTSQDQYIRFCTLNY